MRLILIRSIYDFFFFFFFFFLCLEECFGRDILMLSFGRDILIYIYK